MAEEYREFAPHPALARVVDRFWVRRAIDPTPALILPDGCIDVLIDGAHPDRVLTVVGAMTRAKTFSHSGPVSLAAVRFRPGAAAAVLGVRADELTDETVACEALGIRWLRAVRSVEPVDSDGAVRRLEGALLSRLPASRAHDSTIDYAVAALSRSSPPSIAELARDIGWSRQQLGRAFRDRVGLSPKHFARVARLQRATAELQQGRNLGLASTALALGYFDQAHMNRDFRELAGVTPRSAASSPGSIFPIRSLFAAQSSRS
jgi:AraC-like DNA-binding protein